MLGHQSPGRYQRSWNLEPHLNLRLIGNGATPEVSCFDQKQTTQAGKRMAAHVSFKNTQKVKIVEKRWLIKGIVHNEAAISP